MGSLLYFNLPKNYSDSLSGKSGLDTGYLVRSEPGKMGRLY
jgi:hypothetical protein